MLLAAAATDGLGRSLLDRCLYDYHPGWPDYIVEETRRRLISKFRHTPAQAAERLDLIGLDVELVQPAEVATGACRDPNDLPVLGTVVAGEAERLVTGDRDLLVLGSFGGCVIQTPREFWQSLP